MLSFGVGMIELFSVWTPLPYYNTKYKPIEIGHFFNNGMAQHLKLVSTVLQYNCTCCTILTNLYFWDTAIVVDSIPHVECTVADLSIVLNSCCCIIFHLFFIQSTVLDWLTRVKVLAEVLTEHHTHPNTVLRTVSFTHTAQQFNSRRK